MDQAVRPSKALFEVLETVWREEFISLVVELKGAIHEQFPSITLVDEGWENAVSYWWDTTGSGVRISPVLASMGFGAVVPFNDPAHRQIKRLAEEHLRQRVRKEVTLPLLILGDTAYLRSEVFEALEAQPGGVELVEGEPMMKVGGVRVSCATVLIGAGELVCDLSREQAEQVLAFIVEAFRTKFGVMPDIKGGR